MQDANHRGVTDPSPGSRAPETTETAPGSTDRVPLGASLLDLTHDAIIVRDLDRAIRYWNRGAVEMYGWTADEAVGKSAPELLKTVFPVPLAEIEAQMLRAGRWEGEVVNSRKDGTEVVVASRWALKRDEQGTPVAILVTNTDITERKRAEQARQEIEEQWRAAFEANPTMYVIVDAAGAIVSVNDFGAEQLGYGVSELVGRPVLDVFCEPDREQARKNAESCFQNPGRTMRWEARKVRKDGTMLWVRETANAVLLKKRPVLLVVCEDITERKRAEEELRRSRHYLAETQTLSHTGSWAWSPVSNAILYWSEECYRILGYDPAQGQPSFESSFQRIHPEDRPALTGTIERAVREKAEFQIDYRLMLPDGTRRNVHIQSHPVLDASGELIEFVGTVMDVTEQKRAEEERRAHLWFLESMDRINRAMQRTNDLERMMSDVLDAVLEIFACDRAWLLYPCDPEAPSWRAVMEHTRPEFPGVFALGTELPVDAEVASAFQSARASSGAVLFGPGYDLKLPAQVEERFSIRSQIAMAVYPKVDQPYLFGLHQCSRQRVWTAQEKRLFEEIGRRLADALTSLLVFRTLRESERKLEAAQRIAHLGYWERDFVKGSVALSGETRQLFGDATDLQQYDERYFARIHPEDRPRVAEAFAAALRGGPSYDLEYRVVRADGALRIVHSQGGYVTRDESGQPVRMFGTIQDITELRQAEEELRASEARFRSLTELSSDWYWEQDESLRFTYVSNQVVDLTGYPPESSIGKTRWELAGLTPLTGSWSDHQAVLAARQPFRDFECSRVGTDGTIRYLSMSGAPIFDEEGRFKGYQGVTRNITERKRTAEALRQSEERFALAVAGANEGIFDWDLAADRVFLSDRAQQLLGFDPGEPWRSRDEWSAAVRYHPDDLERQRSGIRAHLAGEAPAYDVEFRLIPPDGGCRWFRQRGVALRDASGKAYRMAGSIEDVTDRKAAADELRLRKEELQRLMDSVSDYLWSAEVAVDGSFSYRYYSPVVERILGRPPEYLMESPQRWLDLLHPLDRPRLAETFRRITSGATDREHSEYRIVRPDGVVRWVRGSVHATRAADGRILLYGVVGDITDRKLAEEGLRESEARFRSLTELSSDWYWQQDENLRFTVVSSGAFDLGNYAAASTIGRTRWELPNVTPLSFTWVEHQAVLAARQPFRDLEYRRGGLDGSTHYISISGAPIFDENGRFKGYQGIGRNITERKRAEAERVKLEERLRQAEKMQAIGTLAGGIAHDFNNLLGAILGYGELAQRKAGESGPLREHLDQVMQAGNRGKRLVEHILAFSRSGVGERLPVHVQSVVEETLDLLAASLPPTIRLEKVLRGGDAAVAGDATQLHQVTMNLCTNAVQAMPKGGVLSVTLERTDIDEARELAHGTLAPGPYIRLQVTDTGSGIPPAVLERIFDPFFTTKRVGEGTGLGLSLVYGIVADFGGAVDVETREGAGTTFTVWLPSCGEAPARVVDAAGVLPHGNGEAVMIVDDERPLVNVAEEMLAGLGYEPVGFSSSADALAAFRAEPERYDIVLTDETMPDLTGTDLAREIRRLRADIPIVLMSGYSGPQLTERARAAGVSDILRKPLVSRDIAEALARVIPARV